MKVSITKGMGFGLYDQPAQLAGVPGSGPNNVDPSCYPLVIDNVVLTQVMGIPAGLLTPGFAPASFAAASSFTLILKNMSLAGQVIRIAVVPDFGAPNGWPLAVGEGLILSNIASADALALQAIASAAAAILDRIILMP